jgi:hypothetical protein
MHCHSDESVEAKALANISASFELFCSASGVEALAEMMDHDARAICAKRNPVVPRSVVTSDAVIQFAASTPV